MDLREIAQIATIIGVLIAAIGQGFKLFLEWPKYKKRIEDSRPQFKTLSKYIFLFEIYP